MVVEMYCNKRMIKSVLINIIN